jgi:hypothetical protein
VCVVASGAAAIGVGGDGGGGRRRTRPAIIKGYVGGLKDFLLRGGTLVLLRGKLLLLHVTSSYMLAAVYIVVCVCVFMFGVYVGGK